LRVFMADLRVRPVAGIVTRLAQKETAGTGLCSMPDIARIGRNRRRA